MSIEEQLTTQYGPLLSTLQLAKVLHRDTTALRVSLRASSEWARAINAAKLKLGRRVYFRTNEVARLLSGGWAKRQTVFPGKPAVLAPGKHEYYGAPSMHLELAAILSRLLAKYEACRDMTALALFTSTSPDA